MITASYSHSTEKQPPRLTHGLCQNAGTNAGMAASKGRSTVGIISCFSGDAIFHTF
jgi:hypothetical protein